MKRYVPAFFTMLVCAVAAPFLLKIFEQPTLQTVEWKWVASSILFLSVGLEATHVKSTPAVRLFAWHSVWPALLVGACISLVWLPINMLNVWVVAWSFALSALPILSLWLKVYQVSLHDRVYALQSVAWVDVVAWIGLAILIGWSHLLYTTIWIVCGIWVLYLIRKKPIWWFLIAYVVVFAGMHYTKAEGLMWALAATWGWRQFEGAKIPEKWLVQVLQWFAIPVLLLLGFSGIAQSVEVSTGLVFSFICLPLITKYASVWWACKRVPILDKAYPWPTLLNARGMTELVFLYTAFTAGALNEVIYICLIYMSVLGTITPIVPLWWRKR
jgi:hypothetical protein